MSWTPSMNSMVSFVLNKAVSALEEIKKQGVSGTESDGSVAKIICNAVDLCREKADAFSGSDVKEKIIIISANLLDMIVVLMRIVKQMNEKGLTPEIVDLLKKNGLMK